MTQSNVKLLHEIERYLKEPTVITARDAYMIRFKPLHSIMMDGVIAIRQEDRIVGETWFMNVDYGKLNLADLQWISDALDGVPNAEYGESTIEDAHEEEFWCDAMLKRNDICVTLAMIRSVPSVRAVEDFF